MADKIHALEEFANKALVTREYIPLLDFETSMHLWQRTIYLKIQAAASHGSLLISLDKIDMSLGGMT